MLAGDLVVNQHILQFLRGRRVQGYGEAQAHVAGLAGRRHRLAGDGLVILLQGAAAAKGAPCPFFSTLRIDSQQVAEILGPIVGAPFPGAAGHVGPLPGSILPFGLRRKPERNARCLVELLQELLNIVVSHACHRGGRDLLWTGIRAHDGLPEGLGDFRRADGETVQDHLVHGRRPVAAHVQGLAHGKGAGGDFRQTYGLPFHRNRIKAVAGLAGRQVGGSVGDGGSPAAGNGQQQGGRPKYAMLHHVKQSRSNSCKYRFVPPLIRRSSGVAPLAGASSPQRSMATTFILNNFRSHPARVSSA